MTAARTANGRARLLLSLIVEPGDPRLAAAMQRHDAVRLLESLRAGRIDLPESWRLRLSAAEARLDATLQRADDEGLRWITPQHRQWPRLLDDLDFLEPIQSAGGAPLGLWVRGDGDLRALTTRSVAIVGARSATSYGLEQSSELAADCSDRGLTIVSGAAFGIDAAAMRGALAVGRAPVAVLASGADIDSPRSHAALLARIVDSGGLVVSEQAPGQVPARPRFLSRNRLIAGIACGTVVVEAAMRSGSLNTLHWADRLGRPTMVFPGPVTSAQSGGTHRAIRDGKAILVTDHHEVMAELGHGAADDQP